MLTVAALAGGLVLTIGPAYGDVASSYYTIGTAVGNVVASPAAVAEAAPASFAVTFKPGTSLAGTAHDRLTVMPSQALGSAPTKVKLSAGSCNQSGTAGAGGAGSSTASGLAIELARACSISATTQVQITFTADAPDSYGTPQLRCHDVEDLDAGRVQLHHRRHVAHIVGPVVRARCQHDLLDQRRTGSRPQQRWHHA